MAKNVSLIPKVRKIANEHTAAKIDGVLVDAWTANVIVKVYDALNEANKAKLEASNIVAIANVCLRLAA